MQDNGMMYNGYTLKNWENLTIIRMRLTILLNVVIVKNVEIILLSLERIFLINLNELKKNKNGVRRNRKKNDGCNVNERVVTYNISTSICCP